MLIGIDKIPKNILIARLLAAARNRPAMDVCALDEEPGGEGATVHGKPQCFCVDCWDALCDECGKAHTRNKLSRKHTIRNINSITDDDMRSHAEKEIQQCPHHKREKLSLYCRQCDEVMCTVCYVAAHQSHNCTDLKQADQQVKADIAIARSAGAEVRAGLEDVLKANEQVKQCIHSQVEQQRSESHQLTEPALRDVRESSERLLHQLSECANVIEQRLTNEEKKGKCPLLVTDFACKEVLERLDLCDLNCDGLLDSKITAVERCVLAKKVTAKYGKLTKEGQTYVVLKPDVNELHLAPLDEMQPYCDFRKMWSKLKTVVCHPEDIGTIIGQLQEEHVMYLHELQLHRQMWQRWNAEKQEQQRHWQQEADNQQQQWQQEQARQVAEWEEMKTQLLQQHELCIAERERREQELQEERQQLAEQREQEREEEQQNWAKEKDDMLEHWSGQVDELKAAFEEVRQQEEEAWQRRKEEHEQSVQQWLEDKKMHAEWWEKEKFQFQQLQEVQRMNAEKVRIQQQQQQFQLWQQEKQQLVQMLQQQQMLTQQEKQRYEQQLQHQNQLWEQERQYQRQLWQEWQDDRQLLKRLQQQQQWQEERYHMQSEWQHERDQLTRREKQNINEKLRQNNRP